MENFALFLLFTSPAIIVLCAMYPLFNKVCDKIDALARLIIGESRGTRALFELQLQEARETLLSEIIKTLPMEDLPND